MTITLPIPPSVNHLYGRSGWRTYIKPKGVEWFTEAGWELKRQYKKHHTGDVAMYIKLYTIRMDLDNVMKATADLFQKQGVIENDSQINFLQIEKVIVHHKKDQKLEVEIE